MSFSPKKALLQCSCSALFLVLAVGAWGAANPAGQSASDNSKVNKQSQPNADQQSNNSADLKMTQEIRRALIKDKSLSMYAHNVKVITENGKVTLRGPVRSETERTTIVNDATQIAGQGNVSDEMTVAPK